MNSYTVWNSIQEIKSVSFRRFIFGVLGFSLAQFSSQRSLKGKFLLSGNLGGENTIFPKEKKRFSFQMK